MELSITPVSKVARNAGWIISCLLIAFFLFDSIAKIMLESHSVSGSTELGWPATMIQGIGVALLISTILFAFPKTSFAGAILITGYLGGAVAIMIRAGKPAYFAIVFALLVWTGLALRDARVRKMFL